MRPVLIPPFIVPPHCLPFPLWSCVQGESNALLGLGNTSDGLGDRKAALNYYQMALR